MKTITAAIFSFTLVNAAYATTNLDLQAQTAVAQRDHDLNALIVKRDPALRDFYDERFVLTTSSGKSKDRNTLLAEIGDAGLVLETNETSDVAVRVRGGTALLTAILHQKGSYRGRPFDVRLHVTDTWVREKGTWRLLGGHASAI